MFVRGVRAVTHRAESIERGNAERGGQVAVGATAGHTFTEAQTHLRRERLGASEKRGADFAFHRGAIEAAANFETGAANARTQGTQALFEAAHIRNAQRT